MKNSVIWCRYPSRYEKGKTSLRRSYKFNGKQIEQRPKISNLTTMSHSGGLEVRIDSKLSYRGNGKVVGNPVLIVSLGYVEDGDYTLDDRKLVTFTASFTDPQKAKNWIVGIEKVLRNAGEGLSLLAQASNNVIQNLQRFLLYKGNDDFIKDIDSEWSMLVEERDRRVAFLKERNIEV